MKGAVELARILSASSHRVSVSSRYESSRHHISVAFPSGTLPARILALSRRISVRRSRLERLPSGSTRRTERKSESGGRAVDGAPIDSRTNSSGIEMAACAHRRPPPAAPNAHRDAPRARATSATPQPARRAAEVGEIAAFRATAAESAAAATRAAQAAVVATRTRAASPAKDTCARHRHRLRDVVQTGRCGR